MNEYLKRLSEGIDRLSVDEVSRCLARLPGLDPYAPLPGLGPLDYRAFLAFYNLKEGAKTEEEVRDLEQRLHAIQELLAWRAPIDPGSHVLLVLLRLGEDGLRILHGLKAVMVRNGWDPLEVVERWYRTRTELGNPPSPAERVLYRRLLEASLRPGVLDV